MTSLTYHKLICHSAVSRPLWFCSMCFHIPGPRPWACQQFLGQKQERKQKSANLLKLLGFTKLETCSHWPKQVTWTTLLLGQESIFCLQKSTMNYMTVGGGIVENEFNLPQPPCIITVGIRQMIHAKHLTVSDMPNTWWILGSNSILIYICKCWIKMFYFFFLLPFAFLFITTCSTHSGVQTRLIWCQMRGI